MFPLSASSRVLLDAVIVLALTPLAIEAAIAWRGVFTQRSRPRRPSPALALTAAALAAMLAVVFLLPAWGGVDAAGVSAAIRTVRSPADAARAVDIAVLAVQQYRGRTPLPAEVPETLLRAGRLTELQHYYGGLLARDADLSTWADVLLLARTAHQSGWARMETLDRVIARTSARSDLRAAAAILAASAGSGSGAAPEALFESGARTAGAATPLAVFEGWSARDAGHGYCDLLVVFTPRTALAGNLVWLHAYPGESHVYIDVSASFPTGVWTPGDLAWEVFRSPAPRGAALYAGVSAGGDLGPAVSLGRVADCGAVASDAVRR